MMTTEHESTRDAEHIAQGKDDAIDPDSVEPKNTVIGVVPSGGDGDEVVAALESAGVDGGRIRRLQGEAGIEALQPGGSGVVAKLGELLSEATEFRDEVIQAMEAGRCAIMVTEVDDDDGHGLKVTMQGAGLERVHHFGDWAAE